MPAARTSGNNADPASDAQGRFTVALPKDLGVAVDAHGKRLTAAIAAETGTDVELSRAQIVVSLVKTALKAADETVTADAGK